MLLLDSRARFIDAVSVFPDHADARQWYYLPATPHLSTTKVPGSLTETPSFLLMGYTGATAEQTGGFVSFDCDLGIADDVLDDIASDIQRGEGLAEKPRLAPVPLVGGTVSLQMVGSKSGDADDEAEEGANKFVLAIDHPTSPSLYGINQASFSVELDKAGFAAINDTLDGAIMPIAVMYQLDYLALRPAYSVSLKVDWDRVQKHLDDSFRAKVLCFSTEIDTTVDELIESRAIEFSADTFVPEDEGRVIDRRDAAVAQVRQMITESFFTPSLPPWTPEKPSDWEKALGAIGQLATLGASLAGGGGGIQSAAAFSYKHTDYTRIDRRSLDVNFSERTTVKRTIYPQGHLAQVLSLIAASGRPREDFVRRIKVDDPWFGRRRVTVSYSPGLAVGEIAHIDVHADYCGQVKNQLLKPDTWEAEFAWANVVEGGTPVRDVGLSYEVVFKDVDATERPGRLSSVPEPFTGDSKALLPELELFVLKPVPVRAEGVPWDEFSSVQVELRYIDEANGIRQSDTVRLTNQVQDDVWKMFVLDRTHTGFEVRQVFFALDDRDVDTGWHPVDDEQVVVRNPFPKRLQLAIEPPVVWTGLSRVFVDVRYQDDANDLRVEESYTLKMGAEAPVFSVALRNPELRSVYFTVTFQFEDGRTVTVPESITTERRLVISPDMKGRRIATVRRPVDFVSRKMREVQVELRFEDFLGGVSVADSALLDAATESATFEYPYVDEARDKFEYRAVFIMQNGMKLSLDWTATDAADLVLVTP